MQINNLFVVLFVKACGEVFKTQVSMPVNPGRSFVYRSDQLPPIDIATQIGVTSDKFFGSVALAFTKDTFLKVAGSMLGEDYKEITDENADVGAELLNIIFGMCKAQIKDQHGLQIQMAIPTVMRGQNLNIKIATTDPSICVPIHSDAGPFFCIVTFSKPPAEAKA